ncbi:MAG: Hsp20/alpha crystallin family protein [Chloroflexia bacterium]
MRIRRVDLFQDLEMMQRQMERLFNDMWGRHTAGTFCSHETWRPPTDVYETPEGLVVKMELAGMKEQDIEIVLDEKTLLVSGFRPDDRPSERISYYQMGVNYGPFCVQIFLPWPVQEDAVSATYDDGFLLIRLPRRTREGEVVRRVEVRVVEEP